MTNDTRGRGEGVFIISGRLLHTRLQDKSVAAAETDIAPTMKNVLYILLYFTTTTVDIGATIFKCTYAIYTPPYVRLWRRFKRDYNSYIYTTTYSAVVVDHIPIITLYVSRQNTKVTAAHLNVVWNLSTVRGETNKITHVLYTCTAWCAHEYTSVCYTIYSGYQQTYTYYIRILNQRHNNTRVCIQICSERHSRHRYEMRLKSLTLLAR